MVLQRELYECLCKSLVEKGLNETSIENAREQFDISPVPTCKPIDFPTGMGSHGILIPLSQRVTDISFSIDQEIARFLSPLEPRNDVMYLNDPAYAHITLYQMSTWRNGEFGPTSREICAAEAAAWREMTKKIPPFKLDFDSICMTSDGVLLVLWKGSPESLDGSLCEENETRIDQMRQEARLAFPSSPKKQPSVLYHSTIGRIIETPLAAKENPKKYAMSLHAKIQDLRDVYRLDNLSFWVHNMWHLQETHMLSALGEKQNIPMARCLSSTCEIFVFINRTTASCSENELLIIITDYNMGRSSNSQARVS